MFYKKYINFTQIKSASLTDLPILVNVTDNDLP